MRDWWPKAYSCHKRYVVAVAVAVVAVVDVVVVVAAVVFAVAAIVAECSIRK